jgi:hypothetical protein
LAPHSNQKLSFRYFGPFKVLHNVGSVAYRLELPPSSSIHHVFHVSQLKKVIGPGVQVSSGLPPDSLVLQYPEKVLQKRSVTKGVCPVVQALINWSSLPESLATWVDLESLKQRFSGAPAWGQVGSKAGGVVTADAAKVDHAGNGQGQLVGRRESIRQRRPNVKIAGQSGVSELDINSSEL